MFSVFKYIYDLYYKPSSGTSNATITLSDIELAPPYNIPKKTEKIQLLLQIRHIKNIYYKYTNSPSFKQELYDSFLTENDFDSGASAYDDDDGEEIRIFDKYVIQYINHRKEYLQNLSESDKRYQLYISTSKLEEHLSDDKYHILFVMDMTDKNIFEYCYNMYRIQTDFTLIDTLFSAIIYEDMNKIIKIFK